MQSASVQRRPLAESYTLQELRERVRSTRQGSFAFACISSGHDYIQDLQHRLNFPETINQGNAPLCGPAAFLYCVAKSFREVFERYALELALFGSTQLGNLGVEPSQACKRATRHIYSSDSSSAWGAIRPIDWVTLARFDKHLVPNAQPSFKSIWHYNAGHHDDMV